MGKNKKHIKKDKPFVKTHSRKTGAIILISLAVLLVGGSIILYSAHLENQAFELDYQKFLALSCDEMKQEINLDNPKIDYKIKVLQSKTMAGDC